MPARLANALKELQKVASVEVANHMAESIIYLLAYNKEHKDFFTSNKSIRGLSSASNVPTGPADYLSPDLFRADLDAEKKDS